MCKDEKNIFIYSVIGILFFFCVNNYIGFQIDGIIYALQLVNNWFPERFVSDPAFMFGNQDAFSIFSPIYGVFVKLFSLSLGSKIFCIVCHFLIALGVCLLFFKWMKKFHCAKFTFPALLLFFSLYAYGESRNDYWMSMTFIEPYTVSRNLSLGLGVMGLSFFFSKNKWISLIFFACGTLVHPLMTGWALPLWLFYHYPKTKIFIVIISLLFPVTVLFDFGSLTAYSDEWMNMSYQYKSMRKILMLMLCYTVFWGLVSLKFTSRNALKRFSHSLMLIVGIATYWFFATILTHHAFLFQVQPYRVEWLCNVCCLLIQVIILYEKIVVKFRKNEKLNLWDWMFASFLVVFWIDSVFVVSWLIALFLFKWNMGKKWKEKNVCKVKYLLWCCLIGALFVAIYEVVFLMQQRYPSLYIENGIVAQYSFLLVAFFSSLLLFFFKKFYAFFCIVLLACLVGCHYCIHPFTGENPSKAFLMMLVLLIIVQLMKKISPRILFCFCSIALFSYSVAFYDRRSDEQKKEELAIDQFLYNPLFPEIKNRGKMLYFVNGSFSENPRMFFLTGAYYDTQIGVGGLFYEQQEMEVRHRQMEIFYMRDSIDTKEMSDFRRINRNEAVYSKLRDKDSLIVRSDYLCSKKEISHLVSSYSDIPMIKEDSSLILNLNKMVYLYRCR